MTDSTRSAAAPLRASRRVDLIAERRSKPIASLAWPLAPRTGVLVLAIATTGVPSFRADKLRVLAIGESERFLRVLKRARRKGNLVHGCGGTLGGQFVANARLRRAGAPGQEVCLVLGIPSPPFLGRLGELFDEGFALVHQQSYRWPDNTRMDQAIWQKIEGQEK